VGGSRLLDRTLSGDLMPIGRRSLVSRPWPLARSVWPLACGRRGHSDPEFGPRGTYAMARPQTTVATGSSPQ